MEELCFQINEGSDFLKIKSFELAFPNAKTNRDRNAIKANVSFRSGTFQGSINIIFFSFELEQFKVEFKELYVNLSGEAAFKPIDCELNLKISGDGFGHFTCEINAREFYNEGAKIDFELKFDQTQLLGIVKELEIINSEYPLIND